MPDLPRIATLYFNPRVSRQSLATQGTPSMTKFGIGQPVRRVEDARLLAGAGRYTDDINLPRQAHAFFLRSPHAERV